MHRLRTSVGTIGLTAAGLAIGAGVAAADPITQGRAVRPATPGSYQGWGPLSVADGSAYGRGNGVFGERYDATAVGGTQTFWETGKKDDGAYVYTDYYF